MRLIRRMISVSCLACAGFAGVMAQTITLETLLDQLEEQGATIKSMAAALEQKKWTDILEEFDEGEFGRFLFLKGKEQVFLRKEIEAPQLSSLVIADGEVVFFQPVIKQAQKFRLGKNKDKAEFLVLGFGTTREALEEAYELKLLGEEKVGDTQAKPGFWKWFPDRTGCRPFSPRSYSGLMVDAGFPFSRNWSSRAVIIFWSVSRKCS